MKEEKDKKEEIENLSEEELEKEENVETAENEEVVKDENEISESDLLTEAEERIKKLEEEKKDANDAFLRKAAEFENYKRRTDAEQMNLLKYAAEPFILKILPVFDDLERSLNHISEEKNREAIEKGLRLVHDKFRKVLEEQGVEKIKSKGEPFDFNYHEALMQQVAEDVPAHTVLEEIEPGYVYKDKVLKHAKVIVSQQPADNSKDDSEKS